MSKLFKGIREFCKKVVIIGCVGYTAQEYIATPWYLEETSMEPTLKAKQIILTRLIKLSLMQTQVYIITYLVVLSKMTLKHCILPSSLSK